MIDPIAQVGVHVPDFLEVAARAHPTKTALVCGDQAWSFSELHQAVEGAARLLSRNQGHELGGRLGILSGNRPGVVMTVHAAARLGVSLAPLSWRLSPSELAWQIRAADVRTLVVDDAQHDLATRAIAGSAASLVPISELETAPKPFPPATSTPPIALDREAMVIFTSGTSGRPKGARLTYGNLWFSATSSALHLGHYASDIWLAVLPLFHVGGLSVLYRGVIGAIPVVLQQRFDPASVLGAIDDGVSLVSLAPTMLQRMIDLRESGPWPATLRTVLLGGGPTPVGLIEQCVEQGIPIAPTYGLTESSSQATTLDPRDVSARVGSSGLPLPVTRLRIFDEGQAVGPNQIGEIQLKGPTLFDGYLGQDHQNQSPDWFSTGDAGYLDDDGYLFVVDRRGDLIVSGGENVYPAEIERVLLEHPWVIDAGVVGLADKDWGARPLAAVVWNGDPATADEALRVHCGSRLARFKVPDRFLLVSELPRSASGKLLRRKLAASIADSGSTP